MAPQKAIVDSVSNGVLEHLASEQQLAVDAELARLRSELAMYRKRYSAALAQIDRERERADAFVSLQGIPAAPLVSTAAPRERHAATMVILLSDIHCEEVVRRETVNGLNEYTLAICDERLAELQERFVEMLGNERRLADIARVVVWLGGDMISGMIHPELAEENALHPLAAIRWIGERLRRFIDCASDNADEVIVATSCGNHGRTTDKMRTLEADTSYEHHLYLTMQAAEHRSNVRWHVGEGHLNYLDLDGYVIRFSHGHSVKYQSGIGGIHVPLKKKIAAWDATQRADLTCIGHWHQFSAGRNYVTNGSVIGQSAYAVKIGADGSEPPSQAAIVIDHGRHEVTKAFRLFCDRDLRRQGTDGDQGNDHGDDARLPAGPRSRRRNSKRKATSGRGGSARRHTSTGKRSRRAPR
jgi:hypothetical protein